MTTPSKTVRTLVCGVLFLYATLWYYAPRVWGVRVTHPETIRAPSFQTVLDAKGHATFVYDQLDRRIETNLPAADLDLNGDGTIAGNESAMITRLKTECDEEERRVSETDAAERTQRFVCDVKGRLVAVVDPLWQVQSELLFLGD